jgi:hypothetical protein
MDNENDTQDVVETEAVDEVADTKPEETIDWQARALEAEGRAKRYKTKYEKLKPAETPAPAKEEKKSSDFDYGQKAFLKTYGIAGADELTLVKTFIDRTGDDIDSLVGDDIFNAKLKALRDAKAVKDAIPQSTGRSAAAPTSKADFWLNKYVSGTPLNEVPQEFREEVLDARLKAEERKQKFG